MKNYIRRKGPEESNLKDFPKCKKTAIEWAIEPCPWIKLCGLVQNTLMIYQESQR